MLLRALSVLVYDSGYVWNYSIIHLIIILVPFASPVFSLVLNLQVLVLQVLNFYQSTFYNSSYLLVHVFKSMVLLVFTL